MAETFPTSTNLTRAVKEGIPRDWFSPIDVESVSSDIVVVRRNGRRKAIPIGRPGTAVVPAVIKALAQPKISLLLPAVLGVVNGTRLSTCYGSFIDSWSYQFYGDLIVRGIGEEDEVVKRKIQALLYSVYGGEDLYFLPHPTENGITAFLAVFGLTIVIPYRTTIETLRDTFYWRSMGTPVNYQFAWGQMGVVGHAIEQAWDGASIVMFVVESDQSRRDLAVELINKARVFGVKVEVYFAE